MKSGERSQLVQWFLPQLEKAWDDDANGAAQVLGDRYVQWAGYGLGLQIECSSNQFLSGVERLTAAQVAQLRELGWHDPAGEDLPNHWQVFLNRGDLLDAALALARAVEVLRTPAPVPALQPGPTPTPEVPPRGRGRTVVVVPVFKVGADQVATAALGALRSLGPTVIIDCFRLAQDELPALQTVSVADLHAELPARHSVIVDPGITFTAAPFATTTAQTADLLARVEQVRSTGQDCLVIGPRLLPGRQWLYATALDAEADLVVLALTDHDDGHVTWQLLLDLMKVLEDHGGVFATTTRLEGSVLLALGELAAVVASPDARLQQEALGVLLNRFQDAPWLRVEVREALYRAQLAPLAARARHLPRELETSRDTDVAVQLVGQLLTLVQTHLEHLQEVGFGDLGEVRRLLELVRAAGRRGVPGVEFADHALQWIAESGIEDVEDVRAAWQAVARSPEVGARRPEPRVALPMSRPPAHYVTAGTECTSKMAFIDVLSRWLEHAERETIIGQPSTYGGKAVLRVRVDGVGFHLNGDTRDVGVRKFLESMSEDPSWHVVANAAGRMNKVAFGSPPKPISYFYLYADEEAPGPYTL